MPIASNLQKLVTALAPVAEEGAKASFFAGCRSVFSCATVEEDPTYTCSDAIKALAKEKYGNDILVLGYTLEEIRTFWAHVGYKAEGTIEEPREVSKTIIDIDCKTHANYAEEGSTRPEASDWYDEFEITSMKSEDESKSKTFSIQSSKKHGFNIGGSGGLSAEPGFFNIAGGGIKPQLGINAGYSCENGTIKTEGSGEETKLSQGYQILDKLKVAPEKKIEAKITTWAVSHEADTNLRFTVDAETTLIVRYRTPLSRLLGGFLISTGHLTARDIFRGEEDFKEIDSTVTFKRKGCVSYLSEEVEIRKFRKDLKED